ncbi:MAG: GyrI-like domain-containing protein [Phycisphaerales bacterium]|nr:GyrI-like domain-containing protein [Phycisphaerales bacterium]
MPAIPTQFRIKQVEPQRFFAQRRTTTFDALPATLNETFERVWNRLNQEPSVTVGPAIVRYLHMGATLELEAGFPVLEELPGDNEGGIVTLPGGRAATALYHGRYDYLYNAHQALGDWMREQGLQSTGQPWEIYWVDPSQARDPSDLRTEIVALIDESSDAS